MAKSLGLLEMFHVKHRFHTKTQEFMNNPLKITITTRGQTEKSAFFDAIYSKMKQKELFLPKTRLLLFHVKQKGE